MFRWNSARRAALVVAALALALAGCTEGTPPAEQSDKLNVVATTTIVGDVVRQVGGEAIDLKVLLPPGADPHSYEATPRDVATVAGARAVFANGVGLETFLDPLLQNAGGQAEIVSVSEGIKLRELGAGHDEEAGEHEHGHEGMDPHVWTDPNNVLVWVQNIAAALSHLDPENAATYGANAENYRAQLVELDAWVREQVAQIPEANRKLVTDHMTFGYLAERYGLEQAGTVVSGFTTLAEPSSQEVALLVDTIRRQGIKALFVGSTVNPGLAQRIAGDTGAKLVTLYTGSLTPPGGDADSYIAYTRHNVSAIVEALK